MNLMIKERLELAKERITEIKNESNVGSFSGFFEKTADFLLLLMKQQELVESGELFRWDLVQLQENNHALFLRISCRSITVRALEIRSIVHRSLEKRTEISCAFYMGNSVP